MTRNICLFMFSTLLFGCGSNGDDAPMQGQPDDDESEWLDEADNGVISGALSMNLPGDHGSGEAMCMLNITRAVGKRLASVSITLDVVGKGCDGMGNCSNPDMRSGRLTYNGGIDGDQAFGTMILNYEPPGDSEDVRLWMYDVILNSDPFSRFSMWVDGEPFDVVSSDTRGAENFADGPHLWNTKFVIEADMLESTDDGDQSSPGTRMRGEFSYEGICEVFAKYMQI